MITKRAATGAALTAAAILWLAAPAVADGLPRVVFCDDFTSVDPAQVSFCIEDAQGAVLGGGVSPTADVLPAVVADPEAVGGWRLAIPEGWAGTAVMGAPPLVATPPAAATPPRPAPVPAPATAAPRATAPSAPATASTPVAEPTPAESPAAVAAPSAESSTTAPLAAAPEANLAAQDTGSQGSGAAWWLGTAALLAAAAAAALGLRKRRASDSASGMGGAEGI